MKKIKLFFITVVCALCLSFAFAGCANGDGSYVKDSFIANIVSYDSYDKELRVSFSFKVKLHKAGEYNIEYELCQTNAKEIVVASETCSTTLTKSTETNKTEYSINELRYIQTNITNTTVIIKNVKVTLVDAKPEYQGYAIGFGAAGGLILCGLVVVFILDKLGKLSKLK